MTVSGSRSSTPYHQGESTTSIGTAVTVTSATVSGGSLNLLNNTTPITNLTVTGGSVTTGPGVTAANVAISGVGTLGTAGNYLSVTNALNAVNPTANITVSGGSFAIKGTNLASNIDTLRLSGGTTAISYVPAPAAMPNTNVVVATASMFSPGNGYAASFGGLTLGGNLTFSGGSAAGTSASFPSIAATATAAIATNPRPTTRRPWPSRAAAR